MRFATTHATYAYQMFCVLAVYFDKYIVNSRMTVIAVCVLWHCYRNASGTSEEVLSVFIALKDMNMYTGVAGVVFVCNVQQFQTEM